MVDTVRLPIPDVFVPMVGLEIIVISQLLDFIAEIHIVIAPIMDGVTMQLVLAFVTGTIMDCFARFLLVLGFPAVQEPVRMEAFVV